VHILFQTEYLWLHWLIELNQFFSRVGSVQKRVELRSRYLIMTRWANTRSPNKRPRPPGPSTWPFTDGEAIQSNFNFFLFPSTRSTLRLLESGIGEKTIKKRGPYIVQNYDHLDHQCYKRRVDELFSDFDHHQELKLENIQQLFTWLFLALTLCLVVISLEIAFRHFVTYTENFVIVY